MSSQHGDEALESYKATSNIGVGAFPLRIHISNGRKIP